MSALITADQKNDIELKTRYQKIIIDSMLNSGYDLKKPDDFNVLINKKIKSILSAAVLDLNPIDDSMREWIVPFDIERLVFPYLNYEFLERNLDALITKREGLEGFWYSSDKIGWILEKYRDYILTGNIPDMGTSKESWIPSFGEFDDWKDYCDSLYFLYHGNPEPYMEAYQRLLNCEMRSGKEEKESIIQEDGGVLR